MAPPSAAQRSTLALGLLLGTGCGAEADTPASRPAPTPQEARLATARADEALRRQLAIGAVYHSRAGRRVLYSWTTEAQVAALRSSPTLLTRDGSPERGLGVYATLLARRAAAGDPIATLLQHDAFVRVRFAWPNPWATCCGSAGAGFGDRLIRVVLRDDAWIGRIDTAMLTWRFFDLDDRPVSTASVLAHPERLAAVYFVQVAAGDRHRDAAASEMSAEAHREYVVCNESMIAEWSIGTTPAQQARDEATSVLRLLADWTARNPSAASSAIDPGEIARNWTRPDPLASVRGLYEANLAFAYAPYVPVSTNLGAMAASVGAVPPEAPLRVEPTVRFVLGAVVPLSARSAPPSFAT